MGSVVGKKFKYMQLLGRDMGDCLCALAVVVNYNECIHHDQLSALSCCKQLYGDFVSVVRDDTGNNTVHYWCYYSL